MTASTEAEMLSGVEAIGGLLGLPRRVAKRRIEAGIEPTFKVGRDVCATPTMLQAWLADCEAEALAEAERLRSEAGA